MKVRDLWQIAQLRQGLYDSPEGQMEFVVALNKVRTDINRMFGHAYSALTTSDIASNTELDWEDYYDNVLQFGLTYYLQEGGAYSGEPDPRAEAKYKAHRGEAMSAALDAETDYKTRTQSE